MWISIRSRVVPSVSRLQSRAYTPEQAHRISLFAKFKAEAQAQRVVASAGGLIACLGDGRKLQLSSDKSTPYELAKDVSRSFANSVIVAEANGEIWDVNRSLLPAFHSKEGGSQKSVHLRLYTADDEQAQPVIAHSAAHVLGLALETLFPTIHLCDGPPIDNGAHGEFFYEGRRFDGQSIGEADLQTISKSALKVIKQAHAFERLEVSKAQALELFQHNEYKKHFINKADETVTFTAYKMGALVDLCKGPHIRHTGQLGAFHAHKLSGAYFLGDPSRDQLQRVYGVAYPAGPDSRGKLDAWKKARAESAQRDHRVIGKSQHLFMLHEHSPGSPFFLPHGQRIINRLTDLVKQLYREYDYDEVGTPTIYKKKLWQTSGHWQLYKDEMFTINAGSHLETSKVESSPDAEHAGSRPGHDEHKEDHQEFAMKPMNCPGHCLIFANQIHSYRDLPIRLADFSALHRNEMAGALSGLTRVRKFHQDDAHVFCTSDQIAAEVGTCIKMITRIYSAFGFKFSFALSTRPVDYIGEVAQWDQAEDALRDCLAREECKYTIKAEDGAFYGPKIDVTVTDALQRKHQTATIQLDFQLPQRFNLHYMDETGQRNAPVMIHRAMLGSLERMFALFAEHTAGKWPMWVSPRQVLVVPVTNTQTLNTYAHDIAQRLKRAGLYSHADISHETLSKKIQKHHTMQYNYICVVGENEMAADSVSVRERGTYKGYEQPFTEFLDRALKEAQLPSTTIN